MTDLWQQSNELIIEQLIGLGLCTSKDVKEMGADYYLKKYSYHNFSHFLGLDVHDVGYFHKPLQAGAVLTNEPGIYIAEEGIGVRIENNVVVTEKGADDLMAGVPIEAEEIEMLMQEGKR